MITLINGALRLGHQNGGHLFANCNFGNYDLTLTDPATLYGTTVLDHSDLTISGGSLDNNGTLIAENGSDLTIQNNLTGSGTIVSVDSSVLIAGSAPYKRNHRVPADIRQLSLHLVQILKRRLAEKARAA
jgi:hypothetical protein